MVSSAGTALSILDKKPNERFVQWGNDKTNDGCPLFKVGLSDYIDRWFATKTSLSYAAIAS